ncbi:MAG: glycosyltransferase [Raineya sp.]
MSDTLAPIALFAYNRPWHLKQTIESLRNNPSSRKSVLYCFSDAAKTSSEIENVNKVRAMLKNIEGFHRVYVIEREKNWGLARSIIEGVSEVMEKHQKVIVLEDDLLLAPNFLDFMNDCLCKYEKSSHVFSISAYLPPIKVNDLEEDVFLFPRCASWGWASWQDRWQKADWQVKDFENFMQDKRSRNMFEKGGNDMTVMLLKQQKGIIQSWAIRWAYAHFQNKSFAIYPKYTKVKNIGIDGSGTNFDAKNTTKKYETQLETHSYLLPESIAWKPNMPIVERLRKFYNLSYFRKTINYFKFGIW